jgi:colanic acid biosynthesis protein WcaH
MALESDEEFRRVIAAAPLVSIDLILRNPQGQVLLGYRLNRPARHCWFVPGGRIRKDERLHDAARRIAETEIGVAVSGIGLVGVFEHFYEDNALDVPDLGTHYVVLACEADISPSASVKGDAQHLRLEWWDVDALGASTEVHPYTKAYFNPLGHFPHRHFPSRPA